MEINKEDNFKSKEEQRAAEVKEAQEKVLKEEGKRIFEGGFTVMKTLDSLRGEDSYNFFEYCKKALGQDDNNFHETILGYFDDEIVRWAQFSLNDLSIEIAKVQHPETEEELKCLRIIAPRNDILDYDNESVIQQSRYITRKRVREGSLNRELTPEEIKEIYKPVEKVTFYENGDIFRVDGLVNGSYLGSQYYESDNNNLSRVTDPEQIELLGMYVAQKLEPIHRYLETRGMMPKQLSNMEEE